MGDFTTEYLPIAGDIWEDANVTRPLPPYWSKPTRICLASLLAVFMLLSIVGNSMVVIVIARHRGMRTRTNLFLCSLALADLLCGILDMPFSLVTMIKGDWWFSQAACQFNGFAMPFFFVASIHTLMYISIHKYLSIKAPFTKILTRHRIWLMIAAAWLWAAVAGYVTVHGLNHVVYKANTAQCGPTYPTDTKTYTHILLLAITCYLLPLFVMAFCYIDMFREIRAHSHRLKTNTTIDRDLVFLQQKRVTVTLFLVLLAFLVSWTPFIAYLTYTSALDDKTVIPAWINPAGYWFGYMNSACNPIIYALRSPAFRDGYKQLLCRPGSYLSNEADMDYSISRRFTRFQNFLRDTLPKSLHGSGSLAGASSETPSRKNSLTSLTHYLLFPKSRSLSTNSLPNLRTNAVMRPLRDQGDLTKATFIGGIPVLTKRGKVVCYQDPSRDNRRRPQSNVYYPDPSRAHAESKNSKKSSKVKKQEVEPPVDSGETSGLLSSELETSENWQGSQDSSIWKKPSPLEPDIVIHVQDADEIAEREPRYNRVSSESGFEEGEEAMFVTVAEVEHRSSSSSSAAKSTEFAEPSAGVKRKSAPLLDASAPIVRRQSADEARSDVFMRSFSDGPDHIIRLAVSPVSKSPSDSCIRQVTQPNLCKSSSDPNLKKPQHKSFRRHILKRLFSKSKHKAKVPGTEEERQRSSSVSPPQRGDSLLRTFEQHPTTGRFDDADRKATFAKAASDTCLDRPELSQTDPAISFRMKEKRKKSKSERVKRKKHVHEAEVSSFKKDILVAEDPFGARKSYSVKVRVRRLPSVERLDCTGEELVITEAGQQKKRHKKRPKHTEEVVLEMEELPRCKTVGEFDFEQGLMHRGTKAVAVTNDLGTRVGFYVPEPDDLALPPPALFRCASDPCLTFKRVEEKVIKRRETKKRRKHVRQTKVRKQHGVSICIVDEDQNDETRSRTKTRSGERMKRTAAPENHLLLRVHQPVFRTKSDPPPKSPGIVEGDAVVHAFPGFSPAEAQEQGDATGSCGGSTGVEFSPYSELTSSASDMPCVGGKGTGAHHVPCVSKNSGADHVQCVSKDSGADHVPCVSKDLGADHVPCLSKDSGADHVPCVSKDSGADHVPCLSKDSGADHVPSVSKDSGADHVSCVSKDSGADHVPCVSKDSGADHVSCVNKDTGGADHVSCVNKDTGGADRVPCVSKDSGADHVPCVSKDSGADHVSCVIKDTGGADHVSCVNKDTGGADRVPCVSKDTGGADHVSCVSKDTGAEHVSCVSKDTAADHVSCVSSKGTGVPLGLDLHGEIPYCPKGLYPADYYPLTATASSSGSPSSGLSKASSCNDLNLSAGGASSIDSTQVMSKATSEAMLNRSPASLHQRRTFTGFHTEGSGPDKESVL